MSYNGQIVVDMDTHVREYEDLERTYRENIDPAYHDHFVELSNAVERHRDIGLSTMLFMNPFAVLEPSDETRPLGVYDNFGPVRGRAATQTKAESRTEARREPVPREVHWDPSIRLRDMDRANIDVSVMFPSHSASFCTLRDVGFESALHQAFHRYLSNYAADSDGRLRWVVTATMRDIPASIAELTYWAEKDSNVVGVLIPPACPDGRLLDNPELHPLFQRAQDLDLPILVHGGVLRPPYTAGATELDNSGFLIRAMYQPWSGMAAVGALIGGGVLDTFDKLRIGVFETGGGWMPWLIEALDGSYQGRGRLTPFLGRPPSEVVAEGRLFHAVEGGDQQLNNCIEALGEDIWLFATDYPHTGSPWPFGVNEVTDRSDMAADVKNKILGTNALRLCPRIAG